ncbi:uncharacterized protein SPAPADRAFT_50713 [Spathaspora passalidarum NRRL Y-27907]|uniref:PH domain-containing protein n=1 Tax=Spathaspora passalidarum (strain NRRL Y-27907 / 11-Y1) TaxID=619300 RepID=G3APE7_SPAPN|nr:uncharacterized protein SPAPADRAFT_50713 [Spathaspora passalidarum NRRL Y-27907]EGW32124.1 hypothetical protein SPAPADRAFT_50713 [Spathaspora passalidarum NRRL Y-27907]
MITEVDHQPSPYVYSNTTRPATINIQPLIPISLNQQGKQKQQQQQQQQQQIEHVPEVSPSPSPSSSSSESDHRLSISSGTSSLSASSCDLSLAAELSSSPPSPSPSPVLSITSNDFYSSSQDEYLQLIEPVPVFPPAYDTLPPGGCPKFPVQSFLPSCGPENFAITNVSVRPPAYTPTVYKIGVVARKVECVTPYELSNHKSWKYLLMELNSTQLNFYQIPAIFEASICNYRPNMLDQKISSYLKRINSHFTNQYDLKFHLYCKQMGLLTSKKLVRSYSLQYAKIGLASDYTKKENVLRMRAESEQFLLEFDNPQELVDWNLSISVGMGVSLDVEQRADPKYRTIPRRRRRNQSSGSSSSSSSTSSSASSATAIISSRLRSSSDPFRGRLSKLKEKLSRSKLSKQQAEAEPAAVVTPPVALVSETSVSRSASVPNLAVIPTHVPEASEDVIPSEHEGFEEEDDEYDEEFNQELRHETDGNHSDGEENHHSTGMGYSVSYSSSSDYKWNPPPEKVRSPRRHYRHLFRCIKALNVDDPWLNRSVVIPTETSPLADVIISRTNSVVSLSTVKSTRSRSFSTSSASLVKLPCHYLREYNVGANGLVPTEVA